MIESCSFTNGIRTFTFGDGDHVKVSQNVDCMEKK